MSYEQMCTEVWWDNSWKSIWKTKSKIKDNIKVECKEVDCSEVDWV
jgi:hypothetical protein